MGRPIVLTARRLTAGLGWVPVAAVLFGMSVLVVLATTGPAVGSLTVPFANMVLNVLLAIVVYRTGRPAGLPRSTARFWRAAAYGVAAYSIGLAMNLAAQAHHLITGDPPVLLGGQIVFPIASALLIYAMLRYPSVNSDRADHLTVGLDAAIVLLGGAAFLWYFSVTRHWTPEQGLLGLSTALAVPAMILVTGFATLRIAFVGTGVLRPVPLAYFGISIVGSVIGMSLPATPGTGEVALAGLINVVGQLFAIVGAALQCRANTTDPRTETADRPRRAFTVLPYGASAAALALLLVVLAPSLDWRQFGVACGFALLVCAVSARQLIAMRQNARLLASNHRLTAQLRHQAWYDELTGLANRNLYGRRIAEALGRSRSQHSRVALFLIDLDDFKVVNDTLGHGAGDDLLRVIADRLSQAVRPADVVCRLGGDEFVVIAEGVSDADIAAIADRLVQSATEPVVLAGHTVQVGASVGVSFAGPQAGTAEELLRTADVAMYSAKASGKGGWRGPVTATAT